MTNYDLCLAWNWEYDAEFVMLLDKACQSHSLSFLQITPNNLDGILHSLASNQLAFRAFFDRASESDAKFFPVVEWGRDHAVYRINAYERASRAWDKAAMHHELINAGLYTPYTIILPSYIEQPFLPLIDLSSLGQRFTIKPAHGGGGEGVIIEATSIDQVLRARQEYPADRYLLQAHIFPAQLGFRPAWFRVICCGEEIFPCWWDTSTHVYTTLSPSEESQYGLRSLRQIAESIARICELEIFSTEIALTSDGRFVVVDYVNDQIDLRLQSRTFDGVPDDLVWDIANRLVALVVSHCPPSSNKKDLMP